MIEYHARDFPRQGCFHREGITWFRAVVLSVPILLLALGLDTAFAQSAYKLQAGDSLSISVLGFPELSQRVMIQTDGAIADVLLGRVNAAGADILEVQNRMREMLAGRLYQKMLASGQSVAVRISPDSLVLDIASYGPVYIDGDIAKPGELNFRPGLSVRQAVALAGGYDVAKGRLTDAERFLQAADMQSEAARLVAEQRATQDKISELQALFGRANNEEPGQSPPKGPAAGRTGLLAALDGSSARQLALAQDQVAKEKAYRGALVRGAGNQLQALRSRETQENDGMQSDLADYEKLHAQFRTGNVTSLRIADARRAWQFSASQALQTTSRISDVELELTKALQELDRLENRRKAELEAQLSELLLKQAINDFHLTAIQEKLRYLGSVRVPAGDGRAGAVSIKIRRQLEGAQHLISADSSTVLMPGDVVEVTLEMPDAYAVPGQ